MKRFICLSENQNQKSGLENMAFKNKKCWVIYIHILIPEFLWSSTNSGFQVFTAKRVDCADLIIIILQELGALMCCLWCQWHMSNSVRAGPSVFAFRTDKGAKPYNDKYRYVCLNMLLVTKISKSEAEPFQSQMSCSKLGLFSETNRRAEFPSLLL